MSLPPMPYERHANHANHHDGTGASYNNVDGGYHQHSSQHNHHHHHSHHQEHRDRERTLSAGGFRSLPPLSFALQVPHRSPSWPMAPPASSYPYPPPSSLDCIPPKLEPELQEYQSPPLSPIRDLNELVKRPFITNDKTDADQLRRHKAYSKRDAGKLLKEAEYERDPSLVEVVPEERCRRCSSQYWRCFVERNPDSPRRVCRPCGKNKCSFGNSPNRPTTVDDAMPSPMQYQPSHTPIDHTAPHMPIPIAPASQWRSFGASVEPGTSSSNIGPIRPRPRALSLTPRQFPGTMYPDTPRAWREHDLSSPADSPPMLDDSGDRDLADHSGWATPCTELASPRTDGGAHEPMVALTTAVKKLSPTTATAPTSPTSPTAATPKLASAAPSGRYLELLGVVLKIESLSSEDDRQKLMAKMAAAGELDPEAQARWIKDVTEWSRSREVRARQKANEKRATAESIKAIEARTRALEERTSVLEARAGPGAEGRGSATDATDDSHGHGRGRWGLSPAPAGV